MIKENIIDRVFVCLYVCQKTCGNCAGLNDSDVNKLKDIRKIKKY